MCLADDDSRLVRLQAGDPEFVRRLHVHAHPDTVGTQRIQATIRWLRENFEAVFLPPEPSAKPATPQAPPAAKAAPGPLA